MIFVFLLSCEHKKAPAPAITPTPKKKEVRGISNLEDIKKLFINQSMVLSLVGQSEEIKRSDMESIQFTPKQIKALMETCSLDDEYFFHEDGTFDFYTNTICTDEEQGENKTDATGQWAIVTRGNYYYLIFDLLPTIKFELSSYEDNKLKTFLVVTEDNADYIFANPFTFQLGH